MLRRLLAVLVLAVALLAVWPLSASADDEYVDFAAGWLDLASFTIPYDAAINNRITVETDKAIFGDAISITLDGATVCSGAAGCTYSWSGSEGSTHSYGISVYMQHGPHWFYRVSGFRPHIRGCSGFGGGVTPFGGTECPAGSHWSSVPKVFPTVSGYAIFAQLASLMREGTILSGFLGFIVSLAILVVVIKGVRFMLRQLTHRGGFEAGNADSMRNAYSGGGMYDKDASKGSD